MSASIGVARNRKTKTGELAQSQHGARTPSPAAMKPASLTRPLAILLVALTAPGTGTVPGPGGGSGSGSAISSRSGADSPALCEYAKPGPNTGGAHNMVLSYMDVRSLSPLSQPEMMWNQSMFQTLLGQNHSDPTDSAPLFDGFLMIGITWFDDKQFYPGGANWTVQADWVDFLHLQLTMGVQHLDAAAASVSPKQTPA